MKSEKKYSASPDHKLPWFMKLVGSLATSRHDMISLGTQKQNAR